MSNYIPNTESELLEMLLSLGVGTAEELLQDIPANLRSKCNIELPHALSHVELIEYMKGLAKTNTNIDDYSCFLGAGAYDHYIPSVVSHMVSRQEFYTAYTPYQPEISQGTLQAIFEYQTFICELTGMEVSNASMYDGATSICEAALMACNIKGKNNIIVPRNLNPDHRGCAEYICKILWNERNSS